MAGTRRPARKRARKKSTRRLSRGAMVLVLIVALAAVAGLYAFEKARHWRPDERRFPDQGALVGEEQGPVSFATLKGLGARFVYLRASDGAGRQDRQFPAHLAAAREAGLEVGAVHAFDPCVPADGQSANFVTMVPRDRGLLPPAIAMTRLASDCPGNVSEAAVQSELMTLVNQIESHAGRAVILAPSEDFEDAYGIARRIDRNLWLTRDYREPAYGGRPWVMWTANPALATEAGEEPLAWVVVQP